MTLPLLTRVYSNPQAALGLALPDWSLLIRQARNANMLARLGYVLAAVAVPAPALVHIQSQLTFARRFSSSLQWEIDCIATALQPLGIPLVLLKGAAYHAAGNTAAQGRIFSDVDILVPEAELAQVELALIRAGWSSGPIDAYDQKYYRQWMHEIPPMQHIKRQTSIDVHHNILPKTCRFCPDAAKLLARAVPTPGGYWVLAPEDRVIHSAAHLFLGGEFNHGFRDLTDLDLLLKEFSAQSGFWEVLLSRAAELKQTLAVSLALRYTGKILHTPIPAAILEQANLALSPVRWWLFDALFLSALQPDHHSCRTAWSSCAEAALFMRSHWLKMPLHLLAPHLLRKSLKPLEVLWEPKE